MEAENKQTMTKQARLIKVVLNDEGDHIAISTGDSTFFDRFTAGFLQIADEAAGLPGEYRKIEKKHRSAKELPMYKNVDIARADAEFSRKAVKIIDNLFGEGTLKKYFRKLYDEVPDFLPGAECFVDFFGKIMPVMETLFNRKIDANSKERIESMAGYMHWNRKPHRTVGKKHGRRN